MDPAGRQSLRRHVRAVRTPLQRRGLYVLNSITWSHAIRDSEQALEYFSNATAANPQNIYNLAGKKGPSSFDVNLIDTATVIYNLPFGKGGRFMKGANPILNGFIGGWQLTGINTANTGLPINVYYPPSTANDVTGLTAEYRGEAFLRPNVNCTGGVGSNGQSTAQMLLTYFAGCTFTTPPAK